MDSLIINSKTDSPEIIFDISSGRYAISGESRPENASAFFHPVINWLKNFESFLQSQNQDSQDFAANFIFQLDYFNSSSAKWFVEILFLLKKYVDNGYNISIEWLYADANEDIYERGLEFSEIVELEFVFKKY